MGILQYAAIVGGVRLLCQKPSLTALTKKKFYLVCAKVSDLSFIKMPTHKELLARIRKVGGICLGDIGSNLRFVYDDQKKKCVLVAKEQIAELEANDNSHNILGVKDDKGHWMFGCRASHDARWSLLDKVTFVRYM